MTLVILQKGLVVITKRRADTCVLLEDWTNDKTEVKFEWPNSSWPDELVNTVDLQLPGDNRTRRKERTATAVLWEGQKDHTSQIQANKKLAAAASTKKSWLHASLPPRPQKKPCLRSASTATESSTTDKAVTVKSNEMIGKEVAV